MSKQSGGNDLNARVKQTGCQWCQGKKDAKVGPLLLCPKCDRAAVILAATSLGKPPE